MATKRTPRRRELKRRLTDGAEALYARACVLDDTYEACMRNEGCWSSGPGEYCAQCKEFLDTQSELKRVLQLRPWQTLPLDYPTLAEALEHMTDPMKDARVR
jgi:hypothetical protein